MTTPEQQLSVSPPALPKGGGAIQGVGKGWGAIGLTGAASSEIPLPITPGRYGPALSLVYSSGTGRTEFGQGWALSIPAFGRRLSGGVPTYGDNDEFVAPNNDVLVVERNQAGTIVSRKVTSFRGATLDGEYEVVRYFPRVDGAGDKIESWRRPDGKAFWMVHGADGTLHIYGNTPAAQTASAAGTDRRIAQWWLEESVTAHGEKIRYEYVRENAVGLPADGRARDHRTHIYPWRILYGNKTGSQVPDCLAGDRDDFHFELLFDYGERTTSLTQAPSYAYAPAPRTWPLREDPYASFAYGFEDRALRLCHQVLMFHRSAAAPHEPALVGRLLLEYESSPYTTHLVAAHRIGYDKHGQPTFSPPLEFSYTAFDPPQTASFVPFEAMPGLNDGVRYQMVDLYGEGTAGVLHQAEKGWLYREPVRGQRGGDDVAYDGWSLLPDIPAANTRATARQSLSDITGDGKLDWVVAGAGMAGFFTMNPDRTWSGFVPFAAFPAEFASEQSQLADLVGAGLPDLAMIGTRSVRLYPSAGESGYGLPIDVPHLDDALPGRGDGRGTLVAFGDILGSGQQHLIRIQHDRIEVWPNLGRGKFGQRLPFASLPFSQQEFDAGRVRLADLAGTGAADLIYLQSEGALIFRNCSGHGLAEGVLLPWPAGVRYDHLCELSTADLQGLGCSSLVLTVPHMIPRHWRCDFARGVKPFLLSRHDNNMGASGEIVYRSSAQEWLDEKRELQLAGKPAVCRLPFPVPVVVRRRQTDQIVGQTLTQRFSYRHGFYDGQDREFRGFGLLLQYDSEAPDGGVQEEGFSAPMLVKTWLHVGHENIARDAFDTSDPGLASLGATLHAQYRTSPEPVDHITDHWDADMRHQLARALSGSPLRVETLGLDGVSDTPYSVVENRYLVRVLREKSGRQPYAVVQPLLVETRTARYERMRSDPRIEHAITLRWDAFGSPLHSAVVHYARRPAKPGQVPEELPDEDARRWWQDSHDEAQASFYLAETRAQTIHVLEPDRWRVGLPYRTRSNAWSVARAALPLSDICYEKCIDRQHGPLADHLPRTLTALTVQRYVGCAPGQGSLEALPDYVETAELDKHALSAYDGVVSPEALERLLTEEAKYHRMATFLPEDDGVVLWSVQHGFTRYGDLSTFFQPQAHQLTRDLGITHIAFDAYRMFATKITTPDGLTSEAWHDYHAMQPERLLDPNEVEQEARYDGAGRVIATAFRGRENGQPVGFAPLSDYVRHIDLPEEAIANPQAALGEAAAAYFYAPFAWMGRVDAAQVPDVDGAVQQGLLMPGGYIRASARQKLTSGLLESQPAALTHAMREAARIPPHALSLQADRYPGDPERQIRMSLSYSDGFGRVLQQKNRVEPGMAYVATDADTLQEANGEPMQAHAQTRWRVSERVDYNNKGLAMRVYRPYFANTHRYLHDEGFQRASYCDRQHYDALNRPTVTWTATGHMRRQTYWPWYTVSEDENDTAAELA